MHSCGSRPHRRHHAVGLSTDRTHFGQSGDLGAHVEEPGDPTGRRRVKDDGVICLAPGTGRVRTVHRLLHLAGEQHIADPGRDRGGEVDGADLAECLACAAQVVEHLQVFQQRLFRVDGEREDLTATGSACHLTLSVGQWRGVEQLRDLLTPLDLGEQHPPTAGGERNRERGGSGRLAGAALAGNHMEAARPRPLGSVRRHSVLRRHTDDRTRPGRPLPGGCAALGRHVHRCVPPSPDDDH